MGCLDRLCGLDITRSQVFDLANQRGPHVARRAASMHLVNIGGIGSGKARCIATRPPRNASRFCERVAQIFCGKQCLAGLDNRQKHACGATSSRRIVISRIDGDHVAVFQRDLACPAA